MEQYTKEDFETPKPYEAVLAVENAFEREQLVNKLSEYCRPLKVNFKRMMGAYLKAKEESRQRNTVYIENATNFPDQPMELDCGDWQCTAGGVIRRSGMGTEIACPHPIMPVERLVNIDTGEEKLRIAYSKGSKWRELIMDKRTLASANSIVSLASNGIAVTSENAKVLVRYISEIENINYDRIPERKCVGRLGYIEGEGFSPYMDGLVFDGDANFGNLFKTIKTHGNSKEWVATAKECRKMSTTARIMLAASFASVLVQPFGVLPFFVHLWAGESGTGKTVALMLAASVWADPPLGKYVQTFEATEVGMEQVAAFLNSLPMCVDELQLAKDRRGNTKFNVYKLAQGVGRIRGAKSGGITKTPTWGNCILTTGESPLTSVGDGAGAVNRVIDIECKSSEKVISDGIRISGALRTSYGHAGRLFVKNLSKPGVMESAKERYEKAFRKLSDSDTTEKQAMAAALIVVADELATDWFFHDGAALTVEQIAEFLQTKASVSAGDRGYRYMCDWVSQNAARMRSGIENGETYGIVEDDWAYIISKVFREAVEGGGFSYPALVSYLKPKGLIQTRGRNSTKGKRINGILTECIVMRLSVPGDEATEDKGDFEEII